MSAAVVTIVAITLVLCVFFALRAKVKEREDHMFEKIMLAAAGTVTQKNVHHSTMADAGDKASAKPEADVRTIAGMRSMELVMREFAFYCAQYAKSR